MLLLICVLWDTKRKDHIIYREDLSRMKKDAMIVDVSCDRNGGIETSIPTTIENPTYKVDGVIALCGGPYTVTLSIKRLHEIIQV